MKTSTLLTAVFGLGLVSAQNLSGQPACASPCLSSAITAAGCPLTDQGCQCGTGKASIQALVATCLIAGCNAADLAAAASVGNALCVAYSKTAPPATTTTTSEGAMTIQTSTGPLSTTGSALGSTTTATTSLASTTGTSTSGGVSASSGSGSGSSAATSPATTSAPSSRPATSGSGTGAAQGSSSTSTAGAAQGVVAGAGGVVGLLLGLVAAL